MHHLRKQVKLWQTIYNSNYAHKNVQNYYNEKCTYNVIIHWNLLYALKIWNRSLEAILEGQGW